MIGQQLQKKREKKKDFCYYLLHSLSLLSEDKNSLMIRVSSISREVSYNFFVFNFFIFLEFFKFH